MPNDKITFGQYLYKLYISVKNIELQKIEHVRFSSILNFYLILKMPSFSNFRSKGIHPLPFFIFFVLHYCLLRIFCKFFWKIRPFTVYFLRVIFLRVHVFFAWILKSNMKYWTFFKPLNVKISPFYLRLAHLKLFKRIFYY